TGSLRGAASTPLQAFARPASSTARGRRAGSPRACRSSRPPAAAWRAGRRAGAPARPWRAPRARGARGSRARRRGRSASGAGTPCAVVRVLALAGRVREVGGLEPRLVGVVVGGMLLRELEVGRGGALLLARRLPRLRALQARLARKGVRGPARG